MGWEAAFKEEDVRPPWTRGLSTTLLRLLIEDIDQLASFKVYPAKFLRNFRESDYPDNWGALASGTQGCTSTAPGGSLVLTVMLGCI